MSRHRSALRTVPFFDLSRYLGKWHEIARLPNRFQTNCDRATAEYSLREDGVIQVANTCRKTDGRGLRQVKGVAKVVNPENPAKLKVSFLPGWLRWTGLGRGDYWIIDLADDYTYAVVGEPGRRYLWILCREPWMPSRTYEAILQRLEHQGYDLSSLITSWDGAIRRAG